MRATVRRVRFNQSAFLGNSNEPFLHLTAGFKNPNDNTSIGKKPIKMVLDDDKRFLRVEIPGEKCIELVPLTNINCLRIDWSDGNSGQESGASGN